MEEQEESKGRQKTYTRVGQEVKAQLRKRHHLSGVIDVSEQEKSGYQKVPGYGDPWLVFGDWGHGVQTSGEPFSSYKSRLKVGTAYKP